MLLVSGLQLDTSYSEGPKFGWNHENNTINNNTSNKEMKAGTTDVMWLCMGKFMCVPLQKLKCYVNSCAVAHVSGQRTPHLQI